jgi:uncharacterized delta-60 repeat protein
MKRLIICVALLWATSTLAATNGLDASFGTDGIVFLPSTPTSQLTMSVFSIAVQSDGKLLLGGRSGDSPSQPSVGRLNADGSWDTTFGDHGIFVLPADSPAAPLGGDIRHVVEMSGSVLAVGGRYAAGSAFDFSTCVFLMKLTSSGALDSAFADDGAQCFNFDTESTRPLDFAGVLVAGNSFYLTSPAVSQGAVAEFDAQGQLVTSFGSNGVAALPANVFTYLLTFDPLGNLLAIGQFNVSQADTEIAAVRLHAGNGSVDTSYGTNDIFLVDLQNQGIVGPAGVSVDSTGRLLIGDNDFANDESYEPYKFYRATSQGAVDTTFNAAGQQPGAPGFAQPVVSGSANVDSLVALHALADGRIFAVGSAQEPDTDDSADLAMLRLNADSSYDTSFGDAAHPGWASVNLGAIGEVNGPTSLAVDASGRGFISVPAADATTTCVAIVRVILDRLFANSFDNLAPPSVCPP